MIFITHLLLSISLFLTPITVKSESGTAHLSTIFNNPELRQQFAPFIDNILRQVSSEKFYHLIDSLSPVKQNDANFYSALLKKIHTVKPKVSLYYQFRSLQHQKKELTKQIITLLEGKNRIEGSIEIGTPGTYTSSLKRTITITGPIYASTEQQNITDRIQCNGMLPYDSFIPLQDYEPITAGSIPDNSVDLVLCVIGLHHIPQEKLAAFIASIARIIRPGGTFILRDHDCRSAEILSIAHVAHSVYNLLIPTVSLYEELHEYRNFNNLEHWINLVEHHGFLAGPQRLLQAGDPTLNTMIKFTKIAISPQDKLNQITHNLHQSPGYERDIMQTYLSAPEWNSVDSSQEYATFIEHTPFYAFPYFASIASYWKVFRESWKVAAQKKGHLSVLYACYFLRNHVYRGLQ